MGGVWVIVSTSSLRSTTCHRFFIIISFLHETSRFRRIVHILFQPPLEVVKQSVHALALEFPPIEFYHRHPVERDRRASSPSAPVRRGRGGVVDRPLVPLEPLLRVKVGVVDEECPPDLGEFVPHHISAQCLMARYGLYRLLFTHPRSTNVPSS